MIWRRFSQCRLMISCNDSGGGAAPPLPALFTWMDRMHRMGGCLNCDLLDYWITLIPARGGDPIMAIMPITKITVQTACRRVGGDGGESNSPSRRAHKPDVLQACSPVYSWTPQAPPTQPGETQPVNLWPPLPALVWPHPGLMAPVSPPPGPAGSRRSRLGG